MVRKFFYVCAGMFLLALAYHLGARDAAGQSRPHIEAVGYDNGQLFVVVNGEWKSVNTANGDAFVSYPLPVPGPVVGIGNELLVYQDGSLYRREGGSGGSWVLKGNVAGR